LPKYLFTFSAVDARVEERVRGALTAQDQVCLLRAECAVRGAVDDAPDSIAFYRAVLDSWDPTHRDLLAWVAARRPRALPIWERFCAEGLLLQGPGPEDAIGLAPRPRAPELARAVVGHRLNACAIRAFLHALYDAMQFAACTATALVVVGRCVGPSCDDGEYA
jgi:hypothetical protein